MGLGCRIARVAILKGPPMNDWLQMLLALLVLVIPIGVAWMALKLSDRKARKPGRGYR